MAKVCPKCNRKFEKGGAIFCDECGAELIEAKMGKKIFAIGVIALLIIGSLSGYYYFIIPINENKKLIEDFYAGNPTIAFKYIAENSDASKNYKSFIGVLDILNATGKLESTFDHKIENVTRKQQDEYIVDVNDGREFYLNNKRLIWGTSKVKYFTKKIDGSWKIFKITYYKNEESLSGEYLDQLLTAKSADIDTIRLYQYLKSFDEKVIPENPEIMKLTSEIISPGSYSIKQVFELYNWMYDNIKFVSSPNYQETIRSPTETLASMRGDSDDIAVLASSLIESVGGTTRIIVTDEHTFVQVYIGDGEEELNKNLREIADNYRFKDYKFQTSKYITSVANNITKYDEKYWLTFDTTSGKYIGNKKEVLKQVGVLNSYIAFEPKKKKYYLLFKI